MRMIIIILLILLTQSCQTKNKRIQVVNPALPIPQCVKPDHVEHQEFTRVINWLDIPIPPFQEFVTYKPLELITNVMDPGFYISVLTYKKLAFNTVLLNDCIHKYHNVIKTTWKKPD